MLKELKRIALKLAQLPRRDQLWVLRQLSPTQREQFKNIEGDALVRAAFKFRHLPIPECLPVEQSNPLPDYCDTLSQAHPLYVAIILEQGQFEWEALFLETYAHQVQLTDLLYLQASELKPATKYYLFQQWQNQLSFNDQLEMSHG